MRQFIAFTVLCLLYSCSESTTDFIQGTASGMDDGTQLYISELGENNKRIALDTATVTNGKFSFTKSLTQDKAVLLLTTPTGKAPVVFLKDNEPVTITIYKDSIESSQITGSEDNVLFNQYRNATRYQSNKRAELQRKMQVAQRETDGIMVTMLRDEVTALDTKAINDKKEIITNNPDKMAALMALSDLINDKVVTIENTEEYYGNLSTHLQKSPIGKSIESYIAQLKSQRIASKVASVGNKAPEFSAKTPDGKDLSLNETLGKATFLLDENGVIIAKNLRGPALGAKMKELLGES